jgi:ATP-dependent Clp protease protease subunit
MKKFWNWIQNEAGGRVLRLEGPIDDESFWGDEVTPKAFREELNAGTEDITVWINSPGGNVFAAAEIYTMLRDYPGSVTVKIDAIAASAASVIAMAGSKVLMSPVAMLMIHDPSTIAMGNTKDMEKAIATLNEVKESIINAYAAKSGLSHNRISKLMENETWMNAKKAVELGFADEILFEAVEPEGDEPDEDPEEEEKPEEDKGIHLEASLYSSRQMGLTILNRLGVTEPKPPVDTPAPTPKEPETPPAPFIDLDGKTEDGSMPFNILMKQLELMH